MLKQDIIIRDLAAKYKKDPRIIEAIVYSPLKFTKRVIENPQDDRPVRIKYFGVFTQKVVFNKDTRMKKLISDLRKDMVVTSTVMGVLLHFIVPTIESASKIIDDAEKTDDYEKIKMIWDALQDYGK